MAGLKMQLLIAALLLAATTFAYAQNCDGVGGGVGRSEPCYIQLPSDDGGGGGGGGGGGDGVSVEDVVTEEFFDNIIDQADSGCEGKGFYTRQAFLDAVYKYPSFAQAATANDSKREIAAFFAHATHETGYFCYIEAVEKSQTYCEDEVHSQYPCVIGKKYYGRGPLQISWNYNYAPAGQVIGFDGLNSPETVSDDVDVSFESALWFWMNNAHDVVSEGFGATIRAINSIECDGGFTRDVNDRVKFYQEYCNQFGVSLGDNLTC